MKKTRTSQIFVPVLTACLLLWLLGPSLSKHQEESVLRKQQVETTSSKQQEQTVKVRAELSGPCIHESPTPGRTLPPSPTRRYPSFPPLYVELFLSDEGFLENYTALIPSDTLADIYMESEHALVALLGSIPCELLEEDDTDAQHYMFKAMKLVRNIAEYRARLIVPNADAPSNLTITRY